MTTQLSLRVPTFHTHTQDMAQMSNIGKTKRKHQERLDQLAEGRVVVLLGPGEMRMDCADPAGSASQSEVPAEVQKAVEPMAEKAS